MEDEEIDCFGTYEDGHAECLICDESEECKKVAHISNKKKPPLLTNIIGIDLGTSNSVMAVIEGERPTIIPNAEGERATPSVVAFDPITHQPIVGTLAKRQAITNPQNTLFSIKRFAGLTFSDFAIQDDVKLAPYKVQAAENGGILVWSGDRWYSPPEILALILHKLKWDAEAYLKDRVTQAVITVPAYFNNSQRQSIRNSCHIAGLEVKRIVNEPTAASLAYGLHKGENKTIAVYHLGGGTFDISILDIGDGVFEVKSTNGDYHLGGDDFDQRIIDWLCNGFQKKHDIDLRQDSAVLQRLKWAAEKAKCELSMFSLVEINLPYVTTKEGVCRDLIMKLTRKKLEELVGDLIEKTLVTCKKTLADAKLTLDDVDEIVLVGQQTRMLAVQESVKRFFNKELCGGVDPDEAVALGAALQSGILMGKVNNLLLLDVIPISLGIETLGGVMSKLISRNTRIPTRKSNIFSTTVDNQTSVDIHVLQGERAMAKDNKSIGRFQLTHISPAHRGVPRIEVTFHIDANAILNVSALDLDTREEKKIHVDPLFGLSKKEIQEAKIRHNAETMIIEIKKKLAHNNLIPIQIKGTMENKILALCIALKGGNDTDIRCKTIELNTLQNWAKVESCSEKDIVHFVENLMKEGDDQTQKCVRQMLRQIGDERVDKILGPRTYIKRMLGHI